MTNKRYHDNSYRPLFLISTTEDELSLKKKRIRSDLNTNKILTENKIKNKMKEKGEHGKKNLIIY